MSAGQPVVREIIAKAVCGYGTFKYQRAIDIEVPADNKNIQVLGTFISNSALDEALVIDSNYGKSVQVKGHYDVHVWYAPDQETRSAKTTVTFVEYIPIKLLGGESISSPQAFARITQKPKCRKSYVVSSDEKSVIRVEVEQELASEVIGLTKLKVGIAPSASMSEVSITGQELLPPNSFSNDNCMPDNCFDLKCEEDFPEEDYEEYSYLTDDYNS